MRRRKRLTGARLLTFVEDFALFADGFDATMLLMDKTFSLLLSLGLHIHETKGHDVATQVGDYLGMPLNFQCGGLPRPDREVKGYREARHSAPLQGSCKQEVGKRKTSGLARGAGSFSSPRHSRDNLFPMRTSRCRQLGKVLDR